MNTAPYALGCLMGSILLSQQALAAPAALDVTVKATQTGHSAGEPLWVEVTLHNNSPQSVQFLTWNTPFEGSFTADMFQIDGVKATYLGKLVKRGAPAAGETQTLAPGAALRTTIDLAQGYAFAQDGVATVRLATTIMQVVSAKTGQGLALEAQPLTSNTMAMSLHDTWLTAKQWQAPLPQSGTANCSSSQSSAISSALSAATSMASDAGSALSSTSEAKRPAAARYVTWFGAYTAQRYSTVLGHFTNIRNNLSKASVDCTCGGVSSPESTFAYVYPTKPYTIHVCGAFWQAPVSGTDSKGGTLVHEMSHFNVIAGTNDHVYGQSGAMNLAKTNPGQAIDNADNHEYFAENNPKLGM